MTSVDINALARFLENRGEDFLYWMNGEAARHYIATLRLAEQHFSLTR